MDPFALQDCQQLLGYEFSNPEILALALTHASVAPTRVESNERLEFLGDAVLGLVVVDELYTRHGELLEGEMTKIKSAVVSRRTCSAMAKELGVCKHVALGKGMAESAKLPMSVAAALFESLVGALYVDGGLDVARDFIIRHIRPFIDEAIEGQNRMNYKSRLQQYAQKRWNRTPEYHLLDEKGPDHSKCFEVAVSLDSRYFPSAWGMNKKDAEQKAAMKALLELDVLEEDEVAEMQDRTL